MLRWLAVGALACVLALGVPRPAAADFALSLPGFGLFIGPPGPAVAYPPPVVYEPPPVVYAPPPVYYGPPVVYGRPAYVRPYGYGYWGPGRRVGWYKHHGWHGHHGHGWDD